VVKNSQNLVNIVCERSLKEKLDLFTKLYLRFFLRPKCFVLRAWSQEYRVRATCFKFFIGLPVRISNTPCVEDLLTTGTPSTCARLYLGGFLQIRIRFVRQRRAPRPPTPTHETNKQTCFVF
jgi:hypothetical protein